MASRQSRESQSRAAMLSVAGGGFSRNAGGVASDIEMRMQQALFPEHSGRNKGSMPRVVGDKLKELRSGEETNDEARWASAA